MLKLITLLLTSSMTVMAGATISPALPQIQQFFQNEPNSEFWVKLMLTLPALFTAISAPFAGIIIDRFGRKPLLTGAVILYGLAGGSGCVLSSLTGLLIGRAFLGIAVGVIMTTFIALIADYYQGPKRNQVMGIQAAFMGLGYVTISLAGNYALVVLGLIIAGLGLGFLLPNMNVWLNAKTPISSRGRVLGGLTTCMFLGQFCSPIVSQPIAQQIGLGVTYGVAGVMMWILAVLLLGASVKSRFSKAA